MYYLIYKTTNKINGKYYIGKHKTDNIDDLYLGYGTAIKNAIKKYGRKNFEREILFILDNEKEMSLKEQEIVNDDIVNDPRSYNSKLGGDVVVS